MVSGPRVVVIGGSLGGLLAANMLWRAGCDVTVHERIGEELAERGVGIAGVVLLLARETAELTERVDDQQLGVHLCALGFGQTADPRP